MINPSSRVRGGVWINFICWGWADMAFEKKRLFLIDSTYQMIPLEEQVEYNFSSN